MKVLTLISRESLLHRKRIMRASVIQLLETLKAVQRPRVVVANARLFCVGIRNAFVPFDDRLDRIFAFRGEIGELLARDRDLQIEPLGLRLPFGVSRRRTLALALETLGLLHQLLKA